MNSARGGSNPGPHYQLQASRADRAQSLVVALLVLLGGAVALLLIVFLFREFQPRTTLPNLTRVDVRGGVSQRGFEHDIEPPGIEDAPETDAPQLQETLQELTLALTSKTALLSQTIVQADSTAAKATSVGNRDADRDVIGDNFDLDRRVDPPKELRFDPESLDDYAAMLDYFGATLVVLEPKANRIHSATDLSASLPTTRNEVYTPRRDFYFVARGAPLKPLEIELARKAGIMKPGGILLTFWPEAVRRQIYQLEQDQMDRNGRTPAQVEKTIYRVEKIGREYKLRIEVQTYTN